MAPTEPLETYRDLFEHVFAQMAAQDLEGWVADQLDKDPTPSWREIERRIEDRTDGVLTLSHVTLSSWFTDLRNDIEANKRKRAAA